MVSWSQLCTEQQNRPQWLQRQINYGAGIFVVSESDCALPALPCCCNISPLFSCLAPSRSRVILTHCADVVIFCVRLIQWVLVHAMGENIREELGFGG